MRPARGGNRTSWIRWLTSPIFTRMAVKFTGLTSDGAVALHSGSSRDDHEFMRMGDRPQGKWGSTTVAVGLAVAALVAVGPRDALASSPQDLAAVSLSSSTSSVVLGATHSLGFRPTPKGEAANLIRRSPWRASMGRVAVPASVDLTAFAPAAGDQGSLSSCVSWSVGYDLMGYFSNATGHAGAPYAPMYLYSQVNGGTDQGSTFSDNFRILTSQGIDTKADYVPQGDFNWQLKPTIAQKANATYHRALTPTLLYAGPGQGVNARVALSTALAAGQPVVLGMAVYDRFFMLNASKSVFTNADAVGQLRGYHAVTAFGYNASGLIIENSWGSGWGNRGFATLGWDFVQNGVIEAWTTAGFANSPVVLAPTSWASAGTPTQVTITAASAVFGGSAASFAGFGWKLTVGGALVPLTWRSPTQVTFNAPLGLSGQPTVGLSRAGVSSIITTPVNYLSSVTGLTIINRVDGARLLTITGAGLLSSAQWNLVSPSGGTSALKNTVVNDLATGAVNRIWVAPDGKSAMAVVGAVDPVLTEAGMYGLSYSSPIGGAQLVWPAGGVPFLAPSVSTVAPVRVTSVAGGDITITGDGLGAFMTTAPTGVRLVSDQTGQQIDLTIRAKSLRTVTVSVPRGTVSGAYHLTVWTPLGSTSTPLGSLTVS